MSRKLLVITFGNAGGGGKSIMARLVHLFAQHVNRTTQIIDADPGNRSVSRVITSSDAIVFGAKPTVGSEVLAVHRDIEVLIIDCGANSSTETYDIVPLLRAADGEAKRDGRRTVGLIPVSPNKPGAVGAARDAHAAFVEAGIDVHVLLNDVDGSKNFVADGQGRIDGVAFPHLSPGIVSVLNSDQRSFHDMLVAPPGGYSRAMDYAARWFERCYTLAAFKPYFDLEGAGLKFGRPAPRGCHYTVSTLGDATNAALALNEHAHQCVREFISHDPDTVGFLAIAKRYRQALIDYAE